MIFFYYYDVKWSHLSYLSFRNWLDLPCVLRFDLPPILKQKTKSLPHFSVNILRVFP